MILRSLGRGVARMGGGIHGIYKGLVWTKELEVGTKERTELIPYQARLVKGRFVRLKAVLLASSIKLVELDSDTMN